MTLQQEQQRDWEELSRLRAENRELREQNAKLKKKINELIERLSTKHGIPF